MHDQREIYHEREYAASLNYDGQGKTMEQETYDSMVVVSMVVAVCSMLLVYSVLKTILLIALWVMP